MSELRNIIDMHRCYAKACFGFAAAKTNLPASRLADAAECRNFDALEIQHELFDTLPEHRQAEWKKRFRVIHAGSLTARSLSFSITSAPEKIRAGFVEESAWLLHSIAAKHGFRIAALDPEGKPVEGAGLLRIYRTVLSPEFRYGNSGEAIRTIRFRSGENPSFFRYLQDAFTLVRYILTSVRGSPSYSLPLKSVLMEFILISETSLSIST